MTLLDHETREKILSARDRRARGYAEASKRVEAEQLDLEIGGEIRRQYLDNGLSVRTISDLLSVDSEIILRILRASISIGLLHRRRDVYWSHREHTYVVPMTMVVGEGHDVTTRKPSYGSSLVRVTA